MRNINTILDNTEAFGSLYTHSMEILKLQSSIRTKLGSPLSDHIYLANINTEQLILYTDSPVWAAKLRYLTTELLDIVKRYPTFKNVTSVRIKINPSLYSASAAESHLSISSRTVQHLEKIANCINDTELQSSLSKLAQNH